MLIDKLQDAALYPHPVAGFTVLETHISWILLTGEFAYKIKKPVDFGFVDFTTLEKRRYYCGEELRLNRRLAPGLYLDVVAIGGSAEYPRIGDGGAAIEYAVKMREFAQAGLLDRVTSRGQLKTHHIDDLADSVADFHRRIAIATSSSQFGSRAQIEYWAQQNFDQMRSLSAGEESPSVDRLEHWTRAAYRSLSDTFDSRQRDGFIRECHGDMHLGNIALIDDRITIFDCLEFNDELRWIDVMSEVAFLVMDLFDHGRQALAHRFLDRYLMHSGDYSGLKVLPFYLVYRALVRAKIDLIQLRGGELAQQQARTVRSEYRSYIALAQQFAQRSRPVLAISHGLSGSGKSTLAAQLSERLGMIRVRSDVERKRLFGLRANAASGSDLNTDLYAGDATVRTYRKLTELAGAVIDAGYSVIVDATFLQHWQREMFRQLANDLKVKFLILDTHAEHAILRARIEQRAARGQDPSEADLAVLQSQIQTQQPFTPDEQDHVIGVDTANSALGDSLARIEQTIRG